MIQLQAQDEVPCMGWTSLFQLIPDTFLSLQQAMAFASFQNTHTHTQKQHCKLMETQSFSYLNEEVASPQASFPCHPSLIH